MELMELLAEKEWAKSTAVQQLVLLSVHLSNEDSKALFLITPKPKRKQIKQSNPANFKTLSFLQKLLLVVGTDQKLARDAVTNSHSETAKNAVLFLLGKTAYASHQKNEKRLNEIKEKQQQYNHNTPAPTSTSVPTPTAAPTSLDHPTHSKYIGSKTLEFRIDATQPMACKVTHHSNNTSLYAGQIGHVAALPGQAAIAGVEVGMHVRRINAIDCQSKDIGWVLGTIKEIKKQQGNNIVLHLSHEPGEVAAEPELGMLDHKDPHESKQIHRTRLMNEWIHKESTALWKETSMLARFHLIVQDINDTEAQRLMKETPSKIRKKLKEKIGIEAFKKLNVKERLNKLKLKEKHAKQLVKEVVHKKHKQLCMLKLGQTKWDTVLTSKQQMDIMTADEEIKVKIQCAHCNAKLHAEHMQRHVDVMHPLGGNEALQEENEAADAMGETNECCGNLETCL